jgi:hypothetical protein
MRPSGEADIDASRPCMLPDIRDRLSRRPIYLRAVYGWGFIAKIDREANLKIGLETCQI